MPSKFYYLGVQTVLSVFVFTIFFCKINTRLNANGEVPVDQTNEAIAACAFTPKPGETTTTKCKLDPDSKCTEYQKTQPGGLKATEEAYCQETEQVTMRDNFPTFICMCSKRKKTTTSSSYNSSGNGYSSSFSNNSAYNGFLLPILNINSGYSNSIIPSASVMPVPSQFK